MLPDKRSQGNKYYSQGNYHEAIQAYQAALDTLESGSNDASIVWNNLAAAYIKLADWKRAQDAASQAILVLEQSHAANSNQAYDSALLKKAHYRRALALTRQHLYRQAEKDIADMNDMLLPVRSLVYKLHRSEHMYAQLGHVSPVLVGGPVNGVNVNINSSSISMEIQSLYRGD